MALRSLAANTPGRRADWRALGLSKEDMEKPEIAVVNSSSGLAICYAHLDSIAKIVKDERRPVTSSGISRRCVRNSRVPDGAALVSPARFQPIAARPGCGR
jgi:dihydroxy-acid dehydratase